CVFQFGNASELRDDSPGIGAAGRSACGSALVGALARLACFCFGFFSFGGSSLGGGVTATTGSACGSGGSSIFSIGFSGCGSGSASCCSAPGATSVVMFGDTATGARSTMTTAVPATRLESSLQRAKSAAAPAACKAAANAKHAPQRAASGHRL